MKSKNSKIGTVDAYIKAFPKNVATRLTVIRKIVRKLAPRAEEKISYGMPGYKLNGMFVYFAAFPNHIGFYPFSSAVKKFKKELNRYKTAKGSIQFQYDEPLPLPLIRKIVRFRAKENSEKSR